MGWNYQNLETSCFTLSLEILICAANCPRDNVLRAITNFGNAIIYVLHSSNGKLDLFFLWVTFVSIEGLAAREFLKLLSPQLTKTFLYGILHKRIKKLKIPPPHRALNKNIKRRILSFQTIWPLGKYERKYLHLPGSWFRGRFGSNLTRNQPHHLSLKDVGNTHGASHFYFFEFKCNEKGSKQFRNW